MGAGAGRMGLLAVLACALGPGAARADLARWLPRQERISWRLLQRNISPLEPKVPGGARPRRGAVLGALHKQDPDYWFHWVRDSAHVMSTVLDMHAQGRAGARPAALERRMRDFLRFTRRVQSLASPHGLGEPRYTVEGGRDTIPWSRPQHDGPALRALAVTKYLRWRDRPDPLALKVLLTDLDFVARVYRQRSFDLWEEYRAENYHTRLVQLGALEEGAAWLAGEGLEPARVRRYRRVARQLERLLDDHWDPARGFLRSQLVIEATDGYTAKQTDLDSAAIIAVVDAGRARGGHSVLDDRVQATVHVLERLFARTYPLNQRPELGTAHGRYQGDVYYGGNPWYLVTAYYARFYYQLARRLQAGATFQVTARNLAFARDVLGSAAGQGLEAGTRIEPRTSAHAPLSAALAGRGDAILRRLQAHIPADGEIHEQFDKTTGEPVSSRGIGWGHAELLAAHLDRLAVRGRP